MNAHSELNIGLSSWIIQDGNYPDFELGKEYKFALEVGPEGLILSNEKLKSLNQTHGSQYTFDAEVLIHEPGLTVIDAGVLCYHEGQIADGLKAGDYISGDLYLGVDPFFWLESHSRRSDVPNLFYRWLVKEILLETTPWQESLDSTGRKCLSRVEASKSFKPVERTNAWEDDDQNAHYVLRCERLGPA